MDDKTIEVTVWRIGRWRWRAKVRQGMYSYGEFGGPYALTRKRCIKKAQRVARDLVRDQEWLDAAEVVDIRATP